ncbi:MAG: hypothetical protein JJ891_17225 [Rhizobiaceae bacterium]|jgi:hypothetical protein|nr:hypothetical protein [Rhizobiaceae bacterium]
MYKNRRNDAVKMGPLYRNRRRSHDSVTRLSQLEYLHDMLPQLRLMALGLEEPTLAYLLELAMVEARMKYDAETFQESVVEGGRKA